MLEGKPTRVDEAVTMRAIKDILSDSTTATATRRAAGGKARTARKAAPAPEPTLTPVKELETKVRPAAFTTIPPGAVPETRDEILRPAPAPVAGAGAKPEARTAAPAPKPAPEATRATRSAVGRIKPRWLAIAVLFGCAWIAPELIVIPFVVVFFGVIGAFVVFGCDRVWHAVGLALTFYEKRRPARARLLMERLDAFAVHWDAFLDYFPDGSVDGLYMPDFANRHERSRAADAQLAARLERMHSQV